ncbi:MAG TPA: hypothetical protein VH370_26385 [Humisphaera sp.]|jgi:hypothetical protein|nr:hypothetical protein [Humisphaera sp.]
MLRELLILLPHGLADRSLVLWLAVSVAGLALATVGGRYSRSLLTLAAVAVGATIGKHFPAWMEWAIDSMGTAFCGAIVLGLIAFFMHRVAVGILLSILLSGYASALIWVTRAGGVSWTMPPMDPSISVPANLGIIWRSLPPSLNPSLPFAIMLAASTGLTIAFLWQRGSRILFHSFLGAAALIFAVPAIVQKQWPGAVDRISPSPWLELGIFFGFIVLSSVIQWLFMPKVARQDSPASEKSSAQDADDAHHASAMTPSFGTCAATFDERRQETATRRQRAFSQES